jgi:hypothetical protein
MGRRDGGHRIRRVVPRISMTQGEAKGRGRRAEFAYRSVSSQAGMSGSTAPTRSGSMNASGVNLGRGNRGRRPRGRVRDPDREARPIAPRSRIVPGGIPQGIGVLLGPADARNDGR